MHSAEIVHRDLKPSNILLNSDCIMKLADFGLARSVACKEEGESVIVSDYIATRWYRAPEILLGSQSYSKKVDMWSTGCILAEVLTEQVLFPGKSSLNQMELVIEFLGWPKDSDLFAMDIAYDNNVIEALSKKKSRSVSDYFKGCDAEAVDLVRKLLTYHPEKRISVDEALQHPYFAQFHNPLNEMVCQRKIVLPIDDNQKLSLKQYRDAIYECINEQIKHSIKRQKTKSKKFPPLNKQKSVHIKRSKKSSHGSIYPELREGNAKSIKLKHQSLAENKLRHRQKSINSKVNIYKTLDHKQQNIFHGKKSLQPSASMKENVDWVKQ